MLLRTGKPPFANGQAGTAFFGVKEKSCGLQVLKNCCRLDSWMVSVEEVKPVAAVGHLTKRAVKRSGVCC